MGALGVVFGDIGTSPLYALRETFLHDTSLSPTPEHVLGVLSTLFWAVTLTVTIKYVTLIMRADNKGEGGVLALATLGTHGLNGKGRRIRVGITLLAVVGLALFYGDAIITPAISVMSAVEGLSAVTPAFEPFVVPLALVILVALFMLQARGTADVGRLFGPVMLVWFVVLGVLGAWQIAKNPSVLRAINPLYAVHLIADQGLGIFWAFGSIVLAVTGAEALYADMGHFGRQPIRTGWLALVMPGLLLNYFGQGALIIEDPTLHPAGLLRAGAAGLHHLPGGARDLRHGDRLAGRHHRRVLADPPGDPARLPAAHGDPAHLGDHDRPDLHPARSTGS